MKRAEMNPDLSTEALLALARTKALDRDAGEETRDNASSARDFREHTELDRSGLGQIIAEIESSAGILPPTPPTRRGRLGGLAFRLSGRMLWWIPRAFRIRDSALSALYEALLDTRRRQAREIDALHRRVEALERALAKYTGGA